MSLEQRRHPRHDVRLSAEFRAKGKLETAVTRNVSVSGAALDLPHAALADGDEVELSLFLVIEGVEDPSKPPLSVGARVVWTGENDEGGFVAGVRFERITPEQTRWLERFLEVSG